MVLAVDAAIFSTTYSSSSLGRSQPHTDRSWRQQLLPAATTAAFCNCFCSLETVASSSISDCSTYLSGPTGTGCCSHLWFPAMSLHVSLLIRDSTSSFAYASLPPGTFPTCDYLELSSQIIQTHSKLTPEISFWGGLDHGAGSLSSACWEGWFPCHTHYPTAGELYVYLWRKHTHDLMVPSQGPSLQGGTSTLPISKGWWQPKQRLCCLRSAETPRFLGTWVGAQCG